MIFSYLLLAAWATAAPATKPSCSAAQISPDKCSRYLWAHEERTALKRRLDGLEGKLADLEASPAAPATELATLAHDGGVLWNAGRLLSGAVDALGNPQLKGSLELRGKLNFQIERLAQVRDRILALQASRGLSTGGPDLPGARWLLPPAAFPALGLPVAQAANASSRPAPEKILAAARGKKTLERQRAFERSARLFAEEREETARIIAAHERGRAQTLGDPARRAGLAHRQNGQTCAVVAAQQLLLEHGRLDARQSPSAQEDALFEESLASGYFRGDRKTGGTPWQFVGNIAQDRGLIIVKRVQALPKALDRLLESGRMAIADVDSSVFWHNRDYHDATHSIVVTGMERDVGTKKALGYYVNDSDGGVYFAAGRLVPADTFLKAWKARGSRFVEVR